MRRQLFEFEDADWLPSPIRDGGLDFLRHIIVATKFYDCVAPILSRALAHTGDTGIIDLCSGGGGPIEQLRTRVAETIGKDLRVTLTDRFPNVPAFQWLHRRTNGRIEFKSMSIDATRVPADLAGFRTMFSAAHHFAPDALREVLRDAVSARRGIALFDASERGIRPLLGIPLILLVHPILFLLCTPFFRPFRWSRLLLTYVVPLIPLYTMWDGCISGLRTHQPEDLLSIARSVDGDYDWAAGKLRNNIGANVAYLVGTPRTA
ncbi:MAG TPA: hypothetical protein VJR92_12475 [Gemmatimonadaceae bacterium]|nr:hypothetical protein [Gemmatimonadaceae bacterium]